MHIDITRWANVGRFHYLYHAIIDNGPDQYSSIRRSGYIERVLRCKVYFNVFVGRGSILNIIQQQAYLSRRIMWMTSSSYSGTKFGRGSFYASHARLHIMRGRLIIKY